MAGPSQREIQILMTMQDRVSAQFNAIASSADKAVAAIDRLSSTGANLNAAAAAAQKLATANAQAGASGQAAGNQIAAGANAASRAWTAAAAAAQQAATSAAKATQAANSSPGPNAGSIRGGAGSADAANAAAQAFRNAGAAAAKFASDATSSVSSVTRALAGIGSGVGSGLGGVFSVLSGGLSGLRTAAGGVGSVTSAIAGLGASTATLSTSAGHVNTFSTSISNMVALGASIVGFQGILGTLREAFGGLEEAVIGFNSLQERTQIAFTGIFGGGDEAAKKSQAFIAQLKQFAETTPFDFPELLKAAQGFLGVGLAAEKIIPLLREVAGAATAAGKSSADIAGISKGLQDIFSGGKIHAQDMNQLIQRGIPAWKILGESIQGAGESIDVAIGRARKLAEQGKLSANDFFNAFQAFGDKHNWEAILANAGTTFEGAMSNIRDSLRFLAGDAFQPLFQQISNVAQATETMLSSDAAKQWAADMAATVQEVINGFAPLKDAITNIFTGFQTGGVSGALAALVQEINSFGQSMFGAGWQLIQEFASGIIQGGAQLITDAANSVAQIIADFLIGNSPPPQGPLTAITDGGFALAQAYIDGVSGGFANFDTALTPIVDAFGNIGKNLDLSSASDAFKAAAGNIDAMKSAGTDVDNVLRGINDRLEAMKNAQQDVKDQISDVKSYYTDQIDSLQTVVDSIKDQNDYAARYADLIQKQNDAISQQADLQDKARNAELDAAKIAAEGDPVKRAQLIGQQQLIKSKEQELSLQQRAQQLDEQAAKADQEGQRYQERLNKYEQDRAAARKAGRPFTTLAPEAPNPKDQELARAKLELDRQQLALEQQLAGLQDKGKLAEIASQQAAIKTAADLRHAEEARAKAATEAITNAADIERAQRNIQALPFEQQIEGLKRAQKDALKPLEDQLTVMERQTELVDRQRQQWQGLKQDIAAAVSQQTALNTAAEKASKANAAANPTPNNLRSQPIDTSLVEAGKRAGTSFLTSFTDYLRDNWPKLVGGAIGAQVGGALFGPLGALAGGLFGSQLVTALQAKIPNLGDVIVARVEGGLQSLQGVLAQTGQDWAPWAAKAGAAGTAASEGLSGLSGILQALQFALQGNMPAAVDAFESSLGNLSRTLDAVLIVIGNFLGIDVSGAGSKWEALGQIIVQAGVLINQAIDSVIASIANFTGADISGAQSKWEAIGIIWTTIQQNVTTAITDILAQIASLVGADLGTTNWETFKNIVSQTITDIASIIQTIKDWTPIIAGVVAAFATFSTLTKIVAIIASISAVIGPLVEGIGILVGLGGDVVAIFAATGSASVAFGAALDVLGVAIAAVVAAFGAIPLTIAAVAVGIGILVAAFVGNWGDIQGATQSFLDWFSSLPETISGYMQTASDAISGAMAAVVQFFSDTWTTLSEGTATGWAAIQAAWQAGVDAVIGIATAIWEGIQAAWQAGIDAVVGLAVGAWQSLSEDTRTSLTTMVSTAGELWSAMGDLIQAAMAQIVTILTRMWGEVQQGFQTALSAIGALINSQIAVWTASWNAFSTAMAGIWQTITSAATTAWNAFTAAITAILTTWWADRVAWWNESVAMLGPIWAKLEGLVGPIIQKALDSFTGMFSGAITKIMELVDQWAGAGKSLAEAFVNALTSGIDTGIKSISDKITGAMRSVLETIRKIIANGAQEAGQNVSVSLGTGIDQGAPAAASAGGNLATGTLSAVDDGFQMHSPSKEMLDRGLQLARSLAAGLANGNPEIARNIGIIVRTAIEQNVDPLIAVALAHAESGLRNAAAGDNGRSVGLFQLHEAGQGAGLSRAQRMDPVINSSRFLTNNSALFQQIAGTGLRGPQLAATYGQRAENSDPRYAQRYAQSYQQVIAAAGSMTGGPMPTGTPRMSMPQTVDQLKGLPWDEAIAACGPAAAVFFANAVGRTPTLQEARDLAAKVGWNTAGGMNGTQNFMRLLSDMGINAAFQATDSSNTGSTLDQALAAGHPAVVSTPNHYFQVRGGSSQTGYDVGSSGTVFKGGSPTMSLDQITKFGGGINGVIVLTDQLKGALDNVDNTLTTFSGNTEAETAALERAQAAQQAYSDLLSGAVAPAGALAGNAIQQMTAQINPLMATVASGTTSTDDLVMSIAQLADQTGLTSAPLEALKNGSIDSATAMQQIIDAAAQVDPAFVDIQKQLAATGADAQTMAVTFVEGVGNATGQASAALTQMSQNIDPLIQQIANGSLQGEDLNKTLVQMASSAGLATNPFRDMQNGVQTSNEALATLIKQTAEVNPGFAELAKQVTETGTVSQAAAIQYAQLIAAYTKAAPAAQDVADSQAAIGDAAHDTLPDLAAVTTALQTAGTQGAQKFGQALQDGVKQAITSLSDFAGEAHDRGVEIGDALARGVEDGINSATQDIVDQARKVVEDAIKEMRDAADAHSPSRETHALGRDMTGGLHQALKASGHVTEAAGATVGRAVGAMADQAQNAWNEPMRQALVPRTSYGEQTAAPLQYLSPADPLKSRNAYMPSQQTRQSLQHQFGESSVSQGNRENINQYLQAADQYAAKENLVAAAAKTTLELQLKITSEAERILPIKQAISDTETAIADAQKGSLDDQLKENDLNVAKLKLQQQENELAIQATAANRTLRDLQAEQSALAKGSIDDQLKLADINTSKLKVQQQENELVIQATVASRALRDLQAQQTEAQKGSLETQLQMAAAQSQIAHNAFEEAKAAQQLLPIKNAIRDTQQQIDDIQNGSVASQQAAIAADAEQAKQKIALLQIQDQLDSGVNGTSLSQDQINSLQEQAGAMKIQAEHADKLAQITDLQKTVDSAALRERLVGLQAQQTAQERALQPLQDQSAALQALLDTQKAYGAAQASDFDSAIISAQALVDHFAKQKQVLDDQLTDLGQQEALIKGNNDLAAAGLQRQIILSQAQVDLYNKQKLALDDQIEDLTQQENLIKGNHDLAAAGLNRQLILQNNLLAEESKTTLEDQRRLETIQAQSATYQAQLSLIQHLHDELERLGLINENPPATDPGATDPGKGGSSGSGSKTGSGTSAGSSGASTASKSMDTLATSAGKADVAVKGVNTTLSAGTTKAANAASTALDNAGTSTHKFVVDLGNVGTGLDTIDGKKTAININGQQVQLNSGQLQVLTDTLDTVDNTPVTIQVDGQTINLSATQANGLRDNLNTLNRMTTTVKVEDKPVQDANDSVDGLSTNLDTVDSATTTVAVDSKDIDTASDSATDLGKDLGNFLNQPYTVDVVPKLIQDANDDVTDLGKDLTSTIKNPTWTAKVQDQAITDAADSTGDLNTDLTNTIKTPTWALKVDQRAVDASTTAVGTENSALTNTFAKPTWPINIGQDQLNTAYSTTQSENTSLNALPAVRNLNVEHSQLDQAQTNSTNTLNTLSTLSKGQQGDGVWNAIFGMKTSSSFDVGAITAGKSELNSTQLNDIGNIQADGALKASDAAFDGDLKTDGDARVDGDMRTDGDFRADGDGKVSGDFKANDTTLKDVTAKDASFKGSEITKSDVDKMDVSNFDAGGGGKALGGPVMRNAMTLVGERGPELFTPFADGMILTHAATERVLRDMNYAQSRYAVRMRASGGNVWGGQTYGTGEGGREMYLMNQAAAISGISAMPQVSHQSVRIVNVSVEYHRHGGEDGITGDASLQRVVTDAVNYYDNSGPL